MKKIIFIILFFYSLAEAETNYGNTLIDEVTSIYDGDTFRVNIK